MRRVLGRRSGRVLVTVGHPDPAVRRVPALGHRASTTARAQNDLEDQFEQAQQRRRPRPRRPSPTATTAPSTDDPDRPTTDALAPVPAPPEGEAWAASASRRSALDQYVVEGVDVDDLRKGPGHYPSTPLPGHEGNAAIAGHRTTYGAPFGDLDELGPGDEITVVRPSRALPRTRSTEQLVVDPSQIEVLDPTPDPTRAGPLAGDPHAHHVQPEVLGRAAAHRPGPARAAAGSAPLAADKSPNGKDATTIGGLSGESSSRHADDPLGNRSSRSVGLLWWLLFHRHPRWTTWFVGVVPFLVVLFVCYTYLERLLPSNY